jgi:hypothetical protein
MEQKEREDAVHGTESKGRCSEPEKSGWMDVVDGV